MKKFIVLLFLCVIALPLSACYLTYIPESEVNEQPLNETETEVHNLITVKIGDRAFDAELYDNKTSAELIDKLPLTLEMKELNGNEKYFYFDTEFSTQEEDVKHIQAGDIMLYQDNCLVVFYKSFYTTYSYTKIGRIKNTDGLEEALGNGSIMVEFTK